MTVRVNCSEYTEYIYVYPTEFQGGALWLAERCGGASPGKSRLCESR
jgi:hypothetical protein